MFEALPSDSPIFVHFDASASVDDWARLVDDAGRHPNVKLVRRHRCWWGSFGIVQGTIEMISEAIASRSMFDYGVLLSGSDFPIKSNSFIQDFFSNSPNQEYMECFPVDGENRWSKDEGKYSAKYRYAYYHAWFRSRNLRLTRRAQGPNGLRIHGGSQWWALTRPALEYVDAFIKSEPTYTKFYRHTLIPDESFFQTILGNSPFSENLSGGDITLALWNKPEPPYPALLGMNDWEAIVQSKKLFARKFSADIDSNILKKIEIELL